MLEAIKFLNKEIEDNATLVVAISGGPDSMCLLSLVCQLNKNLKVVVAHVNHKIRIESDEEAIMVENFTHEKGFIFELLEINEFKNGDFTEELARKKRYEFFEKLIRKYQAKYLLTAHHGDDLVETILMRLTRGSTLSGYAGIRLISNNANYKILRPLLYTNKNEIIKYLDDNNIPYAIDKSNSSLKYTRNRYRHKLLPFLKEESKNIHQKYLKFSEELQDYEKFVNDYINNKKIIVDNSIDINKIKKEDKFIQRKTIELVVKDIQEDNLFDISDKNMNDLLKLIYQDNKRIDLKDGYKGINSYGYLKIVKDNNATFEKIILDKDTITSYFKFYYNSVAGDDSNNTIYLSNKEIKLPIYLRSRIDGDKMYVKNLGNKKVKDIFINSKIPKEKRDDYPILVDSNNEILWIPGIKKSKFAKDKLEKYDIIVKCEAR